MFDDEKLNESIPGANIGLNWVVQNANVNRVLYGGEDLNSGDVVAIGFGDKTVVNILQLQGAFRAKKEYVCYLTDHRDKGFNVDNLYGASIVRSYYLTNKEVLVAMTSTAGFDECSGMYLDAFESLISSTVSSPVAEVSPKNR